MFNLETVPSTMVIIGGGAIGSEMAQAFARLGCTCSVVQMDPHLIPVGTREAGELLEEVFKSEGIEVYNSRRLTRVEKSGALVKVHTEQGDVLEGETLLVAAGRKIDLSALDLEKAGVEVTDRGAVRVDKYLRTSKKHIYGVGDCNGHFLLTHAAMHQGMIALMNCMMPIKRQFSKFVVPWTVFTEPQVSQVGRCGAQLDKEGVTYMTVEMPYEDYGATVAENVSTGFIKVFCSKTGRIYGACIVGEGSGDMINEWALAIQKKVRMHDIMMLQHSFPTMGFISKMLSERWMMKIMESKKVQRICQFMYRL
jgi:pyruvate/2-oxoglutarate dehydrogenase complex dihydrolipoamide dehydrogenase (E3) component